MKKAIVLLLACILVGALFAEEAASPWTLTGNAWVKWGVNLGTSMHGFDNGYDLELNYKLADIKGGATGEGVYGKIDITDLALNISADDAVDAQPTIDALDGSVSASIVAGPLTIAVYDIPSFTFNNAAYIEPYSKDGYDDLSSSAKSKIRATQSRAGGTSVKYSLGTLGTVEARIASLGDWGVTAAAAPGASTVTYVTKVATAAVTVPAANAVYYDMAGALLPAGTIAIGTMYVEKVTTAGAAAVTASENDKYMFAGYVTLTPISMLTVAGGFMMNPDAEYTGFTGKVTLTPVTDLSVVAGLDGVLSGEDDMKMDIGANVSYKLNEGKDTVSAIVYYANDAANNGTNARFDAALKIADAEGFVPGLTLDIGAYLIDLMADPANEPQKIAIAEKLSYKLALSDTTSVTPYEKYATSLNLEQSYLSAGVDIKMVTNTTISVDYTFGSITDDALFDTFVSGASADIADGVFSIKAKIAF